jgi:hypothetical protein
VVFAGFIDIFVDEALVGGRHQPLVGGGDRQKLAMISSKASTIQRLVVLPETCIPTFEAPAFFRDI